MNSDFFKPTVLIFGIASFAMAAEVSLPDDGKLSGEVTSMDADGTIELVSPFSAKPMKIRGDKAIRVDFGAVKTGSHVSDQKVELSNGDVLPVRVNVLANDLLSVESEDLGQISIPREILSSIQLGIFPKRVIYSGPTDFTGWIREKEGSQNWTIDGDQFVAEGLGMISKDVGLPEKFIIKFSFAWNNYPNFQFRFADPQDGLKESADRYIFQIVGSGLGIFRESTGGKANVPIVFLNRTSERQRENQMDIEIRMDRSRGKIQLLIDGEMEGGFTDPIPGIPSGTGISLVSKAPRESSQRVGKIEILEWDDRGDRHRSEERGDGKSDSLIGRNGERLGGMLTGIRKDGETSVYLFKSDFQKDIMELPEEEVSTLFLSGQSEPEQKDVSGGYVLSLRGGGEISVSSCAFGDGKVRVVHPLLGSLEIDRAGITSLERRPVPKAKPIKSQ